MRFYNFNLLVQSLRILIFEIIKFSLQLIQILCLNTNLSFINCVLPLDMKFLTLLCLSMLIILLNHSLVFISQLGDVLCWISIVIEEGWKSARFLLLLLLLSENFELKLHKMNLLLEVVNVFVFDVWIWIGAKRSVERLC